MDAASRPGAGKVYDKASSLRVDGSRNAVHPADVSGRFDRARKVAFTLLIVLLAALPFIDIHGNPAVFLDIARRRFYLLGSTFNAQDTWLVFFLLTGVGYGLIVMTAVWGRVWCGYACPQTVFLEGVFRPIERWIDGPRLVRIRRNAKALHWGKVWRSLIKHTLYLIASWLIAHIVLAYFVSLPQLYPMVMQSPLEHWDAFVWAAALTGIIYFDFSWFREQTCLIVCPYGRLQSVLTDRDSLVIGYDIQRGEPRGKAKDAATGDCVDCGRCVAVCPTGIDIRNGLQLDCIGCARCIDACDAIMDKLGRDRGLIRYDSLNGLNRRAKHVLRPRLWLYGVLGVAGLVAFGIALSATSEYEANLLRLRGAPFVVDGDRVRNTFELHVVNKRGGAVQFEVRAAPGQDDLDYTVALPNFRLASLEDRRMPIFVSFAKDRAAPGMQARLELFANGQRVRELSAPLLAPTH